MRLTVRHQRAIARLHFLDPEISDREIARRVSRGRASVKKVRRAIRATNLTWIDLRALDDGAWVKHLGTADRSTTRPRPVPNWNDVLCELRSGRSTLKAIWARWRTEHPSATGYVQFTQGFGAWLGCSWRSIAHTGLTPTNTLNPASQASDQAFLTSTSHQRAEK